VHAIEFSPAQHYTVTFDNAVTVTGDATAAGGVLVGLPAFGSKMSFNDDLSITTSGGATGFTATGIVDVLAAGNCTITSTDAQALLLQSGFGSLTFDSVTATGSGVVNGVEVFAWNGSVDCGTGSLTGSSLALHVGGGSSNFTYAGAISASGGDAINVNSRSGGSVTLTGNITGGWGKIADIHDNSGGSVLVSGSISQPVGTSTGIHVYSNSGGTVTFSGASKQIVSSGWGVQVRDSSADASTGFTGGGLSITTTAGIPGFVATGGTVAVTGSNNTINSGTAMALSVANATIAAAGMTFQSISVSGATNGIALSNTGSLGSLFVTGDGSTLGSGGSLNGIVNEAVSIMSSKGADLRFMNISDTNSDAVYAEDVSSLTLVKCSIDDGGDETNDQGVELRNVDEVLIDTVSFDSIAEDAILLYQDAGSSTVTITGCQFGDHQAIGRSGVNVILFGSANADVTITGSTFTLNDNALEAVMSYTAATHTGTYALRVDDCVIDGSNAGENGTLQLDSQGDGSETYEITDNNLTAGVSRGPSLSFIGPADATVTIDNNQLTSSNLDNSGGFTILQTGVGTVDATISSNVVTGVGSDAIYVLASGNSVDGHENDSIEMKVTVTDNTTSTRPGTEPGLFVDVDDDNDACVTVTANTFNGTGNDIFLRRAMSGGPSLKVSAADSSALAAANNGAQVSESGTITYGVTCP
jgi:hypothetical protein